MKYQALGEGISLASDQPARSMTNVAREAWLRTRPAAPRESPDVRGYEHRGVDAAEVSSEGVTTAWFWGRGLLAVAAFRGGEVEPLVRATVDRVLDDEQGAAREQPILERSRRRGDSVLVYSHAVRPRPGIEGTVIGASFDSDSFEIVIELLLGER